MRAPAISLQRHVFPVFLMLSSVCLTGASCGKKSAASSEEAGEIVAALDKTDPPASSKLIASETTPPETSPATNAVTNHEPLPGVDLAQLDARKKERFDELVDSLSSPCGKAHSLRTSVQTDPSCKRGRYAARFIASLLEDEADDNDIREFYDKHYGKAPIHIFDLTKAPHQGPEDATVKLVEFFDFGCPACQQAASILHAIVLEYPDDVVLYYKQFPLSAHPDSGPAAAAALAANLQGKWSEMAALLFANQTDHKPADLNKYAKFIGLDMQKFKVDAEAMLAQVEADKKDGDKANIMGTPTLFVNGREYYGSYHPRYLKLWLEEEIGVNR